jgi:hypothetical protein
MAEIVLLPCQPVRGGRKLRDGDGDCVNLLKASRYVARAGQQPTEDARYVTGAGSRTLIWHPCGRVASAGWLQSYVDTFSG